MAMWTVLSKTISVNRKDWDMHITPLSWIAVIAIELLGFTHPPVKPKPFQLPKIASALKHKPPKPDAQVSAAFQA